MGNGCVTDGNSTTHIIVLININDVMVLLIAGTNRTKTTALRSSAMPTPTNAGYNVFRKRLYAMATTTVGI